MNDLDEHVYRLGETENADETWLDAQDALWTSSGLGGPSIAEFLGLSSPYRVTGRQALEQAAALICLDVLSQDISKAKLQLKEKLKGGGDRVVEPTEHYLAEMLELEPNPRHTWVEFVGMMVFHLAMVSNSYALVRRNRVGEIFSIVPTTPMRTDPRINESTGEVFYDITAVTSQEAALLGGNYITAPERDVIHIRQRMLDGFFGYSTLLTGGRTLSLGRSLENYERELFDENGMIRGVFTRPKDAGPMDDPAFRRLKDQLRKLMNRVRSKDEPIVLEDGIDYTEMGMKAHEAEMAKALDNQIEMTCKLWRMPPHKALHLQAVKYDNIAPMEMVYVRDTLVPLCQLIEQRLAKTLLTRQERLRFKFEFNRDEMTIVDSKAETERVVRLVQAGVITLNEGRVDQGYNPRKNGDVYVVAANTKQVDEDGELFVTGASDKSTSTSATDSPQDGTGANDASQTDGGTDASKGLRVVSSR